MKCDSALVAFAALTALAATPAAAQSFGTTVSITCPAGVDEAHMMITVLAGVNGPELQVPVGFNCGSSALAFNSSNKGTVATSAKAGAVRYVIDIVEPAAMAGRCEATVASPVTLYCAGGLAVKKGVPAVKVRVARSR